jgi:hypothetical protein
MKKLIVFLIIIFFFSTKNYCQNSIPCSIKNKYYIEIPDDISSWKPFNKKQKNKKSFNYLFEFTNDKLLFSVDEHIDVIRTTAKGVAQNTGVLNDENINFNFSAAQNFENDYFEGFLINGTLNDPNIDENKYQLLATVVSYDKKVIGFFRIFYNNKEDEILYRKVIKSFKKINICQEF